ncbi:MAG TPA: NADPH-dependent FMN reductase [Cytophagales bacterium]|nr:NADPH-dependent FMN reductase [Cytophagales bacterium]HAA18473.1 NADPH-dependent FMN reductase [Cytophagales bacterium]HAP61501.1 NADPH-dependent FMN reductase [Cytophagales bacterium]
MKKLIAFGASNSRQSINQQLAAWVADQVPETTTTVLDLNDYEMPIYSIDREKEGGIPELAQSFKKEIQTSDGIVISFAEHNGSFAVAFKNVMDWVSRMGRNIWEDKPMFLLATSPGPRGAQRVLEIATKGFPFLGGKVIAHLSVPSFKQNFHPTEGLTEAALSKAFQQQMEQFKNALHGKTIETPANRA